MKYIAVADTDTGIVKSVNQDSLLVKHAAYDGGEVLMAVVCDGMGGLSHGEVASATVIRSFSDWFKTQLPYKLEKPDMKKIGDEWSQLLKTLNAQLVEYGERAKTGLGTTFTGVLFINNQYVIVHVGDTRAYYLDNYSAKQLTNDHTFVAREIARGHMTEEQAKTDRRRNVLLQCIGASKVVEPEIICGETYKGVYMLCSDGFRHKITVEEMHRYFNPGDSSDKAIMKNNARHLIETVKARQERDNISVIVIKAE